MYCCNIGKYNYVKLTPTESFKRTFFGFNRIFGLIKKLGFCGQIGLCKIKISNEEMGEGIWAIRVV